MVPLTETFDGTFPFAPNTFDGRGFVQHYVDEGPRDGEVIICLHGEPTWGYLYRHMIGPLSDRYRVIVPDHMGFGKSETPQDKPYTLQTHTENLAALIDHLGLGDITFVGQDWGGPIATAFTVRHPDRVKRIVFANTLSGYGNIQDPDVPEAGSSDWFRWIGEGLDSGRTEQVLRHAGSTVLSVMKIIGFENSAAVTDTWIRAYSAPFPSWDSAIGVYEFPIDVYTGRVRDYVLDGVSGVPALASKPAILLEGMRDKAIPPARAIADFRGVWPDAPVVEMPAAGHFCQEDVPEILVTNIDQFMQSTP